MPKEDIAMTNEELLDRIYDDTPDEPPLYQVICSDYIGEICDGAIKPGGLMPTAKRIAEDYGVSVSTARRSLRLLAQLGWARSHSRSAYIAVKPGWRG
jgi:DNA-binding GntR family transcriptional regulator